VTTLDYGDIFLHLAFAVLIIANGTFWIQREYHQHKNDPWRILTGLQSMLEWFVPAIVVPLALYAAFMYFY
jgi:amino acid transporter